MSRIRLAAALAAPAVLFLASAPMRAQETPGPAPLKFDWGVPSKVRVTETIAKSGTSAVTRYTISLSRASGGDILLHLSDFEFVEMAGKPADAPGVRELVASMLPTFRAIPDVLLTADGRVKEVVNIEKAVDLAFVPEASASEEKKAAVARLKAQYTTPEAKELMKRKVRAFWDSWVGDWTGLRLTESQPLTTTHITYDPDGNPFDAPTTIRRAAVPGGVELTRETKLDAQQSRQALASWLKKMSENTRLPAPEGFTGLDATDTVVAVTDPATLKPVRVVSETQTVKHRKNAEDSVSVERHEYSFDWSVR